MNTNKNNKLTTALVSFGIGTAISSVLLTAINPENFVWRIFWVLLILGISYIILANEYEEEPKEGPNETVDWNPTVPSRYF